MNLDGLTMSVLADELKSAIQAGQIQKLYQIDKTTLLFKIHTSRDNFDLIITVGASPALYLSAPLQDLPNEPSSLCMFLRKHIEGSRITSIDQINGDRIFCISIDKLEMNGSITTTKIYVELMGKYSNCIFVQDGVILESLIHVSPLMSRERSIGPKIPYELPPNTQRVSLLDISESELLDLLRTFHQGNVDNSIRNIFNGFGKPLLQELLTRAQLDGKVEFDELSPEKIQILAHVLHMVSTELKDAHGIMEYHNSNNKLVHSPIQLSTGTLEKTYETISAAIAQSVKSDGAIHTADRELEKIITNAIKKEELRHSKIQKELL